MAGVDNPHPGICLILLSPSVFGKADKPGDDTYASIRVLLFVSTGVGRVLLFVSTGVGIVIATFLGFQRARRTLDVSFKVSNFSTYESWVKRVLGSENVDPDSPSSQEG
jgi:hypothetical protein